MGRLVHLYKSSGDDDPVVAKSALECAEMLGAFVDVDLILGLVTKHLGLKLDASGQGRQSVEDLSMYNTQATVWSIGSLQLYI